MNVLNFEPRNAMDTRRTEHASACIARSNGLIKSASTSTCCAAENALFQKTHHRQFLVSSAEHADYEDEPPSPDAASTEYLRLPSLSLSHAAVLARNAALRFDNDHHHAAKKSLQHQLRFNRLTHFSDCHLNKIGLPTTNGHGQPVNDIVVAATSATCNGGTKHEEFNSHRALDNVLINRSDDGQSASIINFTAVNDVKPTPYPRPLNGMSSAPGDACNKKPAGNGSGGDGSSSERRRKISVFDGAAPQPPVDASSPAVDNGGDVVAPPPKIDDVAEMLCPKLAAVTTNECSSSSNSSASGPPPAPEKEEKRFRRSSSLKMPKENDSNPAQKKIVRFADALGLDLADVRTFLDELPSVPKSAYSDLQQMVEPSCGERLQPHGAATAPPPETKTLVPMFRQPHTSPLFLDRVRDNFVSLEFAKVMATPVCSISGTVRVRNLDFCKSVYVRYSTDGWRSFAELQAVYVPDSCDGFSDKFAFVVYVYETKPNQRLELAVRFHCSGSIFWDNNNGANYVFQCLPSAPIVPSYFQCFGPAGDSNHSFY